MDETRSIWPSDDRAQSESTSADSQWDATLPPGDESAGTDEQFAQNGNAESFVSQDGVTEYPLVGDRSDHTNLMPDVAGAGDFSSDEAERLTETGTIPSYQLFSPAGVGLAGFWGGMLGGGLLLFGNYWALKRWVSALLVLVFSLWAMLLLVQTLPEGTPYMVGAVISAVSSWILAWILQGRLYQRHGANGGRTHVVGEAVVLGFIGAFLSMGMILAIPRIILGERLAVGPDDEVYYSAGATQNDAQRLGAFLKADGTFDANQRQTAAIARRGHGIQISLFPVGNRPLPAQEVQAWTAYAVNLSAELFEGQPVQILLRDKLCHILQQLPPQTGQISREWKRLFDAGTAQFNQGDLAKAEELFRQALKEAEGSSFLKRQLIFSLLEIGNCRLNRQLTDDVEPHFQRALKLARQETEPLLFAEAYALNGLGRWEWAKQHLPKAEDYLSQSLAIQEKMPQRPELGTADNLIQVLIAQQKYVLAISNQDRQLQYLERQPNSDSRRLAFGRHYQGWLHLQAGHYKESRRALDAALLIYEKLMPPEPIEQVRCQWTVGVVDHYEGQWNAARTRYESAIQLLEKSPQFDGLLKADLQDSLAGLEFDQAKYTAAEKLYQEVLQEREIKLGANHVQVGITLSHLARVKLSLGQYPEAETLLQRALGLFEKSQPAERREMAICLRLMAALHQRQGRATEAEPLYRRALTIQEEVLGKDHDQTALTVMDLGKLLTDRGDFVAAEPLVKSAHELLEQRLGKEHYFVLRALIAVAEVQYGQRKLDQAEAVTRQALTVGVKILGPDHPELTDANNLLGVILLNLNRADEAKPFLELALRSSEANFGPNHASLIGPLNNLGLINQQNGRPEAARDQFSRALKLAESLVGPDNPYLIPILLNHARTLRQLNLTDEAQQLEQRAEAIRIKHKLDAPPTGGSVIV